MYLGLVVLFVLEVTMTNGNPTVASSKQHDEEKWYWGYLDEESTLGTLVINDTVTPSTEMKPSDQIPPITQIRIAETNDTKIPEEIPAMCLPSFIPPDKPNFSKPGRRISEAKCSEYIWELNNRAEKQKRVDFCKKFEKWDPKKVVGGKPPPPGEFPHMGAIGWKAVIGTWVFKCGGSLISERFVLTAAHCTKVSTLDPTVADVEPKIVRIGDQTLLDTPNVFSLNPVQKVDKDIAKIIKHPQFDPPEKYYDIALLELKETVTFSKVVQPACLWSNSTTDELGKQANITGWGVVETGSLETSPTLQAATVDMFPIEQCDYLYDNYRIRNWDGFQDHQICAGKLGGGIDSCQGDSGGPLQVKIPLPRNATDKEGCMHYLVGVISFGVGCAHPNLPGIYTRVSSFIDWIEDIVWNVQ